MADIKYTMPPPTEDVEQMCLFRWADAQSGKYLELSLMYHIRITALLRRNKEKRTSELVCGDLILDCNTRRARRGDREMELTVKEYRLLEHFMNNQGVVLSRVNLLKHVWDKNFDTNTNVVDVYVNYLRTKIDKDYENKLIHTVVGLGYIMESH